jgi:tRNA dimethylallyltransferase
MIDEVKKLHKEGLPWKRMEQLGLEYRYLSRFLQNKITEEEMLTQLETAICQYAKRQMTWFKRLNTEVQPQY